MHTGVPPALTTANYDAANQQLTLGPKSATYDNNGNLQTLTDSAGTTTYTWNARDQLVSLSGPSVTASFAYDAVGRRQSKTINGTTTSFLYDGLNVVQELNSTTPTANLLTSLGIDETLLRTDAAGPRSFLTDGLGSTLALTDAAGLVQGEYTYEPFGKTTATGVASTNAFMYTGREDAGTGLYYYRARYYHPVLQRFISEDPLGPLSGFFTEQLVVLSQGEFDTEEGDFDSFTEILPEGFNLGMWGVPITPTDTNLYSYVYNSPLMFTDPTGEIPGGAAAKRAWSWIHNNVKVDGPSAGFKHSQGRAFQIRVRSRIMCRLDLHSRTPNRI